MLKKALKSRSSRKIVQKRPLPILYGGYKTLRKRHLMRHGMKFFEFSPCRGQGREAGSGEQGAGRGETGGTEYKVRSTKYGVQSTEYKVRSAKCGVQSAKYDAKMEMEDSSQPTSLSPASPRPALTPCPSPIRPTMSTWCPTAGGRGRCRTHPLPENGRTEKHALSPKPSAPNPESLIPQPRIP